MLQLNINIKIPRQLVVFLSGLSSAIYSVEIVQAVEFTGHGM
jgi:hypothetical protein